MTSMNDNGGLLRPPYRLEYPSGDGYPKVTIAGDSSGDLTLQVLLSDVPHDKVQLMINHGPSRVGFMDLVGNGPEAQSETRHQKGYGKLLVNLAIQVLRRSEWIKPETPIHATITDERPTVADFWRGFGMTVRDPEPGRHGQGSGKLGDLTPARREYLAGGVFPLSLELSQFVDSPRDEVRTTPRMRM